MPDNRLSDNVFQLYFKRFGSCVYLLKIGKDNILIDTSSKDNSDELTHELKKLKVEPEDIHIILLTHNHYDHIGNLSLFKNAKVYDYHNIDKLALILFRVIKTPGHTNDSLCYLYKNILFSGDTLFHNGIGRTDLLDSNPEKMQESLNKLKKIHYEILAPGHI
ncbi:MAG: MBL fold metallo-hydrolase [Nanoarchaeota archaeon]|nr:MBL fold metallo-hydrolase [Nanoarchaeota archaeon]